MSVLRRVLSAVAIVASIAAPASAQLTLLDSFPSGVGPCACAADSATGDVWVYACFGATVRLYTAEGVFQREIPRPGESANDVDLEVVNAPIVLSGTTVPAGSLLFINGETGPVDIYALNPMDGSILATLNTTFGVGHIVGGGYHAQRNTFFFVQDQVPSAPDGNTVGEVDLSNGALLHSFRPIDDGFSVNFGDLDASADSGNLFIVSNAESTIAEFTPEGAYVQELALPSGVSSLSGIAIIDGSGEAWVAGTGGTLSRLGGFPAPPCACEMTGDSPAHVDVFDLLAYLDLWFESDPAAERTGDEPASVDVFDLLSYLDCWFAGC
jgi:hypothetical protein